MGSWLNYQLKTVFNIVVSWSSNKVAKVNDKIIIICIGNRASVGFGLSFCLPTYKNKN